MQAPQPPRDGDNRRNGDRQVRREDQKRNDISGLGAALIVGAGLLLVAGVSALVGWHAGRKTEAESNDYYTLPDRRSCRSAATEDDDVRACSPKDEDSAGPKCVICLDRPQRFMFVRCRHICLCEPCLIHMARNVEDSTLHGHFDGPVRLACPMCRQVGYVVKTFVS